MILSQYILCMAISSMMGIIEAVMFAGFSKGEHVSDLWKRKSGFDIHILLTAFRSLVFFSNSVVIYMMYGFHPMMLFTLSVVMAFSFWHNGFYYLTRSKLDEVYTGFFDQTKTSSATFSLSVLTRTILFICSLVTITLLIFDT